MIALQQLLADLKYSKLEKCKKVEVARTAEGSEQNQSVDRGWWEHQTKASY
jgi:hypothetical protein